MAVARPRLLVLRALKLGDFLTAIPALRALAAAFPEHERILAAPGWLKPLVELVAAPPAKRAIHRLVPVRELEPLPPTVHGSECAVNLHGCGPQSHRLLLAARPGRVLWFEHTQVPESAGAPRWRPDEHEVVRWCRLLSEYGIAAEPSDIHLRLPASRVRASGATLIHPGASCAARRWPLERFAAVAQAERRRGRSVLITGSREESELAHLVADAAGVPPGGVVAGRTNLLELAATVASAGRVVCGDTGIAHLASAFDVPSVVVFGPTSPARWGPLGNGAAHRVLWAGRSGDPHGSQPDPGLLEIEPEQVIAALAELP